MERCGCWDSTGCVVLRHSVCPVAGPDRDSRSALSDTDAGSAVPRFRLAVGDGATRRRACPTRGRGQGHRPRQAAVNEGTGRPAAGYPGGPYTVWLPRPPPIALLMQGLGRLVTKSLNHNAHPRSRALGRGWVVHSGLSLPARSGANRGTKSLSPRTESLRRQDVPARYHKGHATLLRLGSGPAARRRLA